MDGRILASEPTVLAATESEQAHWVRGRVLRLRGREAPTHSYRTAPASDEGSLTRRLARALTDHPK